MTGIQPPEIRFTLCFLRRDDLILMLHRNHPPNQGKWNGVGGHIEAGEAPLAACLREVEEETGFVLPGVRFDGLLTWEGFEIPSGGLYLFSTNAPEGEPKSNNEGRLAWLNQDWACSAPEVVDNLHVVLPYLLKGVPPRIYHFVYHAGKLLNWEIKSFPADFIFPA